MEIELTLINRSNDADESHIVIFQKNTAPGATSQVVAWRVIHGLQKEYPYTVMFPDSLQIAAEDSYGNTTGQTDVEAGQEALAILGSSGLELAIQAGTNGSAIVLQNALASGAIDGIIYRDFMPIAKQAGISPQQHSVFEFKPTIWIGVMGQVEEGDIMTEAILNDINTQISLLGITRANVIMSGGGVEPFRFALEAVV